MLWVVAINLLGNEQTVIKASKSFTVPLITREIEPCRQLNKPPFEILGIVGAIPGIEQYEKLGVHLTEGQK